MLSKSCSNATPSLNATRTRQKMNSLITDKKKGECVNDSLPSTSPPPNSTQLGEVHSSPRARQLCYQKKICCGTWSFLSFTQRDSLRLHSRASGHNTLLPKAATWCTSSNKLTGVSSNLQDAPLLVLCHCFFLRPCTHKTHRSRVNYG